MAPAATDKRTSSNGARPKLTPRERFEVRVGRIMASLPPKAQLRLSGKPPIHLDGQMLEPDLQLLLAMMEGAEAEGQVLPVSLVVRGSTAAPPASTAAG